ncbi:FkbM family methyltransferase [Pseudomonas sp. PDM15]|uniref:FkbM family methyltransferase n=1 Tax=Pseudomonas sp. PDM15 TaxID=2769303 RepID=UPI00177FF284|nr:FkbM family methyltransferase [Pseudomonas sp. PDM15]MBD9425342.1 FkbM family methyltransferase [Pseudomonas sp. PDM15]
MISYAQNFEDVILERLFKSRKTGFYVDIGACHPIYDSVTHHFYLKGWSGINVEPQPKLFTELQAARERDINLQCCVGAQADTRTFYITKDIGTSTLNQVIAEHYREERSIDQELTVELVTLNQIWSEHVGNRQVDFMKIDVEGCEGDVLFGADFSVVAPSVLVIEATVPNSQELSHEQWEELVLDHYQLIYFDGLNRFYARKGSQFGTSIEIIPPNVFDHFKPYSLELLEQANESLTLDNEMQRQQIQTLITQLSQKDAALNDAAHAYENLLRAYEQKERDLQNAFAAFQAREEELRNTQKKLNAIEIVPPNDFKPYPHELLEQANESLTLDNKALKQQIQTILTQVSHKDAALDDAGHAYENLLKAYEQKERDLQNTLVALQAKEEELRSR